MLQVEQNNDSVRSSEDQNANRNLDIKVLIRSQMERRAVFEIKLEVIHVNLWQRTCLYFVYTLRFVES
jgi:7,8-dihydro-6-hydroxymethylpterin-pyrophosphokinase